MGDIGVTGPQTLLFSVAVFGLAWLVVRMVPSLPHPRPRHRFDELEITAADARLPKYLIAGAGLVGVGWAHVALTSLPPIDAWLRASATAGLVIRDTVGLIPMVGGVGLLAMGLVWRALPRLCRRPLQWAWLERCAFWLTLVGAASYYVAMLGLGLAMGSLARSGVDYGSAASQLTDWLTLPPSVLPPAIEAGGYLALAAVAGMTALRARQISEPRPASARVWALTAASAILLVAFILNAVYAVPTERAKLEPSFVLASGHLVVGVAVAALVTALGHIQGERRRPGWAEKAALGTVGGAGLASAAGLLAGLAAPPRLGTLACLPLALGLLGGLAAALGTLRWMPTTTASGRSSLLRGLTASALLVGAVAGPAAALAMPAVDLSLVEPVVYASWGLGMAGAAGACFAALEARGELFLGEWTGAAPWQLANVCLVGGAWSFWAATLAGAAVPLPTWPLSLVGAAVAARGTIALGGFSWRALAEYRSRGWASFQAALAAYDGKQPSNISAPFVLAIEAVGSAVGFPGFGWIVSGRPLIGLTLALLGPMIAFTVVPTLASPMTPGPIGDAGVPAIILYPLVSGVISVAFLYRSLRRRGLIRPRPITDGERPVAPERSLLAGARRQLGRRTAWLGVGALVFTVIAFPVAAVVVGMEGQTRDLYVSEIPSDLKGSYLVTSGGILALYPWNVSLQEFPSDSPTIPAESVTSLVVVQKQFDDISAYQLRDIGTGRLVPWHDYRTEDRRLTLEPEQPLAPGEYEFVRSTDDMFGGTTIHYFRAK